MFFDNHTLIKSTIAALVIAASSFFAPSAQAADSTCWFNTDHRGDLVPEWCDVTRRINANGHIVWDIMDVNGATAVIVLWDDGIAEFHYKGNRHYVENYTDRDGDERLVFPNGDELAFRIPRRGM